MAQWSSPLTLSNPKFNNGGFRQDLLERQGTTKMAEDGLKIGTINIQALTGLYAAFEGISLNQKKLFIGDFLRTSGLDELDTIIITEAFDNDIRGNIRDTLRHFGFNHQSAVPDESDADDDGGVFIASKFEFLSTYEHVFENHGKFGTADYFANKGFSYAEINKNGQSYHVYGTHMDAISDGLRARQLTEIRNDMKKYLINDGKPIILSGDLNIEATSGRYYEEFVRNGGRFEGFEEGKYVSGSLTFSDGTDAGYVLDHVLLHPNGRSIDTFETVIKSNAYTSDHNVPFTDHNPVLSEISFVEDSQYNFGRLGYREHQEWVKSGLTGEISWYRTQYTKDDLNFSPDGNGAYRSSIPINGQEIFSTTDSFYLQLYYEGRGSVVWETTPTFHSSGGLRSPVYFTGMTTSQVYWRRAGGYYDQRSFELKDFIKPEDYDSIRMQFGAPTIELNLMDGDDIVEVFDVLGKVWAGGGNDVLVGGMHNDQFYGQGGDDIFIGGGWGDLYDGGIGFDTVDYTHLDYAVHQDSPAADKLINIEAVLGGKGNDTLVKDPNNGGSLKEIHGGDGHDYIYGGEGDESLYGDAGFDSLYGRNGNDDLHGGADSDYLFGGAGNDILTGGAGNDILTGGAGNDTLTGGQGNDVLVGGTGADTFTIGGSGEAGAQDTIYDFNAAEDTLDISGGDGNDLILGMGGDDTIKTSAGRDTLDGGEGFDVLDFSSYEFPIQHLFGSERFDILRNNRYITDDDVVRDFEGLIGSEYNDNVLGRSDAIFLDGRGGNDRLIGSYSNDTILGGTGNDRIRGLDGDDLLTGGAGRDEFLYGGTDGGLDTITDFDVTEDRFVLFFTEAKSFADINVMDTQNGVRVEWDTDSTGLTMTGAVLQGLDSSQISDDHFLFV